MEINRHCEPAGTFGGRSNLAMTFAYTLIRRPRRRSLTITVSPENQVRVLAPGFLSQNKIEDFLFRKSSWVLKQIEKNAARPEWPLRKFEAGEKFSVSGAEWFLEIAEGVKGGIEASGGRIKVTVPAKLKDGGERGEYVAWRIEDWYRTEAVKIFKERVAWYQNAVGPKPRAVRVREFRSQWGSASRQRNLNFNWRLLLAPLEILDYVVVHELVHLEHLDHSRRFWARVEEILPGHERHRRWLRTNGRSLRLHYITDFSGMT